MNTPRPLLLLLLLAPAIAFSAAFIVPPDRDLIHDADAIVLGTVTAVTPKFDDQGEIVTDVDIRIREVLKGPVAGEIRIRERGGVVGDVGLHVSGNPEYYPGEVALVFLEARPGGLWRTFAMQLGKFSFARGELGDLLLIRDAREGEIFGWDVAGRRHIERFRRAEEFLRYIRAILAGAAPPVDYYYDGFPSPEPFPRDGESDETPESPEPGQREPAPELRSVTSDAHVPPSAYTMGTFRWKAFDDGQTVPYRITSVQPGLDSTGAAQRALAAWTNDPGSNVRLTLASGAGGTFIKDGVNSIIYDNSTDVPSGAIGYAQIYSQGTHSYKGETFYTVIEGDVVMASGLSLSQKLFDEAVTHEVGHTIALRHSDQAEPSSNNAVMRSVLTGNWGASLAPWDQDAVGHVYTGTSVTLTAPTGLTATATTTGRVNLSWNAVAGADGYRIERKAAGGDFVPIATVSTTSYADTSVSGGKSYLYRVVALAGTSASSASAPDLATTVIFTDPSLVPGSTVIRAVHLTQLRTAVNAVRALAGLGAASWTDPNPAGVVVKAVHWNELLTRLNQARSALGLPTVSFPSSVSSGALIRAAHVEALRAGVR
jgi:hypothetical protein